MSTFATDLSQLHGITDEYGNTGTTSIPATAPTQGGGYVPPSAGDNSGLSNFQQNLNALSNLGNSGTSTTPPASTSSTGSSASSTGSTPSTSSSDSGSSSTIFGFSVMNGVFIVLGLLLIAAGVFSFKSTSSIIETAGKIAANGSELLA